MRNVTKVFLLSCSIIATNAHAGSSALGSLSKDDLVLKLSIAQNPELQDQSPKRIRRSENVSESSQEAPPFRDLEQRLRKALRVFINSPTLELMQKL